MTHKPSLAKIRSGRFPIFLGISSLTLALLGCNTTQQIDPIQASDAAIQSEVLAAWQQDHPDAGFTPDIFVSDGIVFLKGALSVPQMRVDLVREAWQPSSVHEVVDELQVPLSADSTYAKDTSLSVKLRARLTFDPDIQSTHYSIESVGGVIYLMGNAKNQDELDKVKKLAGSVGAKKVISFVQIRPMPPEIAQP